MAANSLSPLLSRRWVVNISDNTLRVVFERPESGWWYIIHIYDNGAMRRCLSVSDRDIRVVGEGKIREVSEPTGG